MEEGIGEECGVAGVYLKNPANNQKDESLLSVPRALINLSLGLEHRGQKSAGMCVYNPLTSEETKRRRTFIPYKEVGRVSEVYKLRHYPEYNNILQRCKGLTGIAHIRYSTSGADRDDYFAARDEVQPFLRDHSKVWKRFAVAFNGNIANSDNLREDLEKDDCQFETGVDTEIIRSLIAMKIKECADTLDLSKSSRPNPLYFFKKTMEKLDGCYNIVSLFGNGDLIAVRDPNGFRPLVYGEDDNLYAVASENYALERIGIKNFTEVEPGEILIINSQGLRKQKVIESRLSFCQFEYVYFAKSKSIMNGQGVREVRHRLGEELAKIEPIRKKLNDDYLVVPIPYTSLAAAEAYAETIGLKLRTAIEKVDPERGFIGNPRERERIMSSNYTVHSDVKGKKVILVDDSIVRGETAQKRIKAVYDAGAKEIHIRLTEPPIISPCFYGIDFPTRKELIAARFSETDLGDARTLEEKITHYLGVESVGFQTIDGLVRAIGLPKNNLCLACLNGEYPTSYGQIKCGEIKK